MALSYTQKIESKPPTDDDGNDSDAFIMHYTAMLESFLSNIPSWKKDISLNFKTILWNLINFPMEIKIIKVRAKNVYTNCTQSDTLSQMNVCDCE